MMWKSTIPPAASNYVNIDDAVLGNQDLILRPDGRAYFNEGLFVTNSLAFINLNPDPGSFVLHDSTSYIVGNCVRFVNNVGSYDYPLGNLLSYQLENIDIDPSSSGLSFIASNFSNPSPTVTLGLPLTEMGAIYSDVGR